MKLNIEKNIEQIKNELPSKVTLIAVSKTKPAEDILKAYECGVRDFGENYVQELCDKKEKLPANIQWHMIGHLQSNKVKYIAPFVYMIHGVDSLKLLKEINKQAKKINRKIKCLLQMHVAQEETKFGMNREEIIELLKTEEFHLLKNITVCGLMTMGSNTDNEEQVKREFLQVKNLFDELRTKFPEFNILSYGMSHDYKMAIECGSTMVRIGSLIFGERK